MALRLSPAAALTAALVGTACQDPFDAVRHDLGPVRIAAIGVEDGMARAAVWSGEGMFHDARPVLEWSLDGVALGQGFDVAVTGGGELALQVTSPQGDVLDAIVTVAQSPPEFLVVRAAVPLGDDLSLDTRLATGADVVNDTVPADDAARLGLDFGTESPDGLSTRWMTAGGVGTLLELDTFDADVLAEEVEFDDGEIITREALGPGIYPQLALVIDGTGGNRWLWIDAAIGVEGPLLRQRGRLVPVDADPPPDGLVAGTLVERDDLSGVELSDVLPAEDLTDQDELPCFPGGQSFDFDWLVEGRCTRPEVLGARVVVQTW